jgi:translocator protein
MNVKKILKILAFVLICQLAGIIGSLFTFSAIPEWYAFLEKPEFAPPNWLFGPVWITLYAMMGISAYLIAEKGWKTEEVRIALAVFGLQLGLNTLWSIVFFGMHSPLGGLMVIFALLASILATIALFWKLSRVAATMLVPYVLWVSFASLLNYFIWALN